MNEFNCKICNFSTKLKNNLYRHFKTNKHIKNTETQTNNAYTFICKYCNHSYKHKQSLYNHQLNCKNTNTNTNTNTQCIEIKETKETIKDFLLNSNSNSIIDNPDFENKLKIILKEAIQENLPSVKSETIINCKNNYQNIQNIQNNIENNNNINIHVFLNEHCKDAMTIQHFIKNLSIDIDDIANKKHGNYFKGVSNIILNNLKPLSITKRPIHCTDTKLSKWLINDAKE